MTDDRASASSSDAENSSTPQTSPSAKTNLGGFIFLGIVLPAIAWLVELLTSMSADIMVNPFPTWWHVGFVALVPLVNIGVVRLVRVKGQHRWRNLLRALVPVSLGVSLIYAVAFVPALPIAAIGVIFFGLGLLPMSPYFCLIVTATAFRRWTKAGYFGHVRPLPVVGWLAVGVLLPILPLAPTFLGQASLAGIAGDCERTAAEMSTLRKWIPRHAVAFPLNHMLPRYLGLRTHFSETDRQAAWYRLYGESEAAMADHVPAWKKSRFRTNEWRSFWDRHQGEQVIGTLLPDLSLAESTMEVIAYPQASLAYAEWTIVVQNDHPFRAAEGRAILQLPPGGVVSRLTLWINGEPQEAAFGGKGQTTQAYQRVVRRQRDPVLVTWHQPEQVFIQCFPVPSEQGRMQMRVAVTFPLIESAAGNRVSRLPHIMAANFNLPKEVPTQASVESGYLRPKNGAPQRRSSLLSVAPNETLELSLKGSFEAPLDPIHVKHPLESDAWIVQSLMTPDKRSGTVRVVVDGSRASADWAEEISVALRSLGEVLPVQIFFAGDELRQSPVVSASEAGAWLAQQDFVGGQDSTDALAAALQARVAENEGTAPVVWFAGNQTMAWQGGTGEIKHLLHRLPARTLHVVRLGGGGNVVLDRLAENATELIWQPLRIEGLDQGITDALRRAVWPPSAFKREVVRTRPEGSVLAGPAATHIARLWGAYQVSAMVSRDLRLAQTARDIGVRMQIVTPVSGAVVLESQQQYDEAGLTPIDPMTAPAVPEPSTYGLIMIGLVFIAYSRHRYVQRRRSAA